MAFFQDSTLSCNDSAEDWTESAIFSNWSGVNSATAVNNKVAKMRHMMPSTGVTKEKQRSQVHEVRAELLEAQPCAKSCFCKSDAISRNG